MEHIFFETKVLWSQIDANAHLRHSAYADFAAQARIELLGQINLGATELAKLKIGPILFREELIYLREIRPEDTVKVSCELSKCRTDGARWSFVQKIYRSDDVLAAIVNVDGSWIDLQHRKLTKLPSDIVQAFLKIPQTENFELSEPPEK